ncbi:phosphoribosyltransferase family protein [Sinomonas sp. JGH33]|uniref:Phosphoribosyltransferase family protein n=1 Tax=Sinomonas terricola TaxID=3110330 RepID=A0ABU5T8Z9_9MICC|nr:phosphoribosyltransferase family protein [Sinomonas sp. JGH33]MEA5456165.1 phosphoribosyltransferase family protein [Sinomonas sp. JGH33]
MAWPHGDAEHGLYADRSAAGRALAAELGEYAVSPSLGSSSSSEDTLPPLVLGLSRGGVAVAAEVARALGLPFDVVPARKLGIPGHEEVAFGAIAACDGVRRSDVDRPLMRRLLAAGFTEASLDRVREREAAELERQENLYLGGRGQGAAGRAVIVCDDGAATGDTARAAIAAVRAAGASAVVLALPVAPPVVVRELAALVDRVVCPRQPHGFRSVGGAYVSFPQCSDEEVMDLLAARG